NYNPSVSTKIYERMVSERTQIAERFKSEGAGEAAKILGQRERDLQEIESQAYRKVQEIEGGADAKATDIYARAYNQSPEAATFFEFVKTLEAYKKVLTADTSLILSTNSQFFRYLKSPEGATAPSAAAPSGSAPNSGADALKSLPSLLDIAR
ncbi:MAG TPA: protease modulator HflC, partial [Prosthecobacter sp.]|nr:protease modulator HflC [Prosthecobacter sp.]